MIKAQDFRVGNYITSKEWKGIHPISGIEITETGFELLINGFVHKYEPGKYFDIQPIPLDESILLKCGFERLNNAFIIDDGSRNEHGEKISGINTFTLFDYSYGHGTDCRYNYLKVKSVHQLQNLFWCLCGKELTIEL